MDIATIYVTAPTRNDALTISKSLIEERLIACANILDGMVSVYRWNGELREDSEAVLLLKTRTALIPDVTERIRSIHPYECPCIVAWKAVGGHEDYSRWVHAETEIDCTRLA